MSNPEVDLTKVVIPGRRLLIQGDTPETTTSGGIVLPDAAQKNLFTAKVLKLGTGVKPKKLDPTTTTVDIAVGDRVLCSRDSMRSSVCADTFGDNTHVVVWETEDGGDGDVLAVFKAEGV